MGLLFLFLKKEKKKFFLELLLYVINRQDKKTFGIFLATFPSPFLSYLLMERIESAMLPSFLLLRLIWSENFHGHFLIGLGVVEERLELHREESLFSGRLLKLSNLFLNIYFRVESIFSGILLKLDKKKI